MTKTPRLKSGFTTGSAAAAGAKAATLALGGCPVPTWVNIPLPNGERLDIPVQACSGHGPERQCTVIKDGGDDPDATHLARITVSVARDMECDPEQTISLHGGQGVGVVTKPGLPVPVGQAAINPAPRHQIRMAVQEAVQATGLEGGLRVTIQVQDGERVAGKTFNPRLGIVGGISILGTRGTVLPFSCQAYEQTITSCLDLARAQNVSSIALCTGGRSERFLRNRHPELPDTACVLVADFLAFSLAQAVQRSFPYITYACFFGKLVKAAQNHPYTHAKTCHIDFDRLALCCQEAGLPEAEARTIRTCNTARQALHIIQATPNSESVLQAVADQALRAMQRFAGRKHGLSVQVFRDDGQLITATTTCPDRLCL